MSRENLVPPGRYNDVCSVCKAKGSPNENNAVMRCSGKGCDVCIHQECYGVVTLPQHKWYCKRCEPHSTVRATKVKCCLCPMKGGPLKATDRHEEFCHIVCALWLEGVTFGDWSKMEPVKIADREQMAAAIGTSCYICHEDKHGKEAATLGMVRKCCASGCEQDMHITCAQGREALVVPFVGTKRDRDPDALAKYQVFCSAHMDECAEERERVGPPAEEGGGAGGGLAINGLLVNVGDYVKAYWRGGARLYPGTITDINSDGTVAISYNDGDFEGNVPTDLVRPQQAARRAAAAAKKAIEVQASKEAAKTEAAAKGKKKEAKEKQTEKAAKAAARAKKVTQKAAAQAGKAAQRAAHKATDKSSGKRKSYGDSDGDNSRPLSPYDDGYGYADKKHRAHARSPVLIETSTDPEHTPHADDFLDSVAALLKKEGQAAAQLVLHNHMSGIDATNALSIDALHRLEKAKSTTTERIAELKEVNLEYTQLQAAHTAINKPEANSKIATMTAAAATAWTLQSQSKATSKSASKALIPSTADAQNRLSTSVYGLLGVDGENDVDAEDFNSYFDELSGYVDGLVGPQSRA